MVHVSRTPVIHRPYDLLVVPVTPTSSHSHPFSPFALQSLFYLRAKNPEHPVKFLKPKVKLTLLSSCLPTPLLTVPD